MLELRVLLVQLVADARLHIVVSEFFATNALRTFQREFTLSDLIFYELAHASVVEHVLTLRKREDLGG